MYEQYIKHYQYWKGCTIPELECIIGFTKYWEQQGIPPHLWREWLQQNKAMFIETGSVHDCLKELKKYAEVSRKKYLEQAEQEEQQNILTRITNFLRRLN